MLPGLKKKQNKTKKKKPPLKKNTLSQTPKRNKEPGTYSDYFYHTNARGHTITILWMQLHKTCVLFQLLRYTRNALCKCTHAPVATQRIALGTVKSTGGDYSSETFSDIHLKLEFELVFLNLPRV